jgi:phosphoribosylaminoimidazole-succinocarboxamide synthase
VKEVLLESHLNLPLYRRGKVRDTYDLGDRLLMVTTDRISAYDVVLPTGIPGRGLVLTQLSAFWFKLTGDVVSNHFLYLVEGPEAEALGLPREMVGRAMVVRKARRLDVECIVRGYLTGSAWQEYRERGTVWGHKLPEGLVESQELPEPLFTPTTKSEIDHDRPLTFREMANMVGEEAAHIMRVRSLALYGYARQYARERGIIIADTKFEFGWVDDELVVIDELLTPDSSRFWLVEDYRPGGPQHSYDKQLVRDYLDSMGWDRRPPAPPLPPEVVAETAQRYLEVFQRLTGQELLIPASE